MTADNRRLLVTIRSSGSRTPLFLVHSLAGELTWLPTLARNLNPEQPIYGFAAPGLNAKGPSFSNLEEMAFAYLSAARQVQPFGPYIFGGYSFGGVLAFEMARQAQQAGEEIEKLILIDAYSPNSSVIQALQHWCNDGTMVQSVGNLLALEWGAKALLSTDSLPPNNPEEQINITTRHLLTHCDVPHSFDALSSLLEKCRQVMNAHTQILGAYRPQLSHRRFSTLLIHNSEGFVGKESVLQLPQVEGNHDHGWQHCLRQAPQRVAIETEHFLIMRQPSLGRVAQIIDHYLDDRLPTDSSILSCATPDTVATCKSPATKMV